MLDGIDQYAEFVYSLQAKHPSIAAVRLNLFPTGPRQGRLVGEVEFDKGAVLRVSEFIDFRRQCIRTYGQQPVEKLASRRFPCRKAPVGGCHRCVLSAKRVSQRAAMR